VHAFCALFDTLDRSSGTNARVDGLAAYFAAVPPADGAWALVLLLGKRRKRLLTGRRLRQICLEAAGLPEWLFDACHAQVGDSAETIALLLPQLALPAAEPLELPLHQWMGERLPALAALEPEAQGAAVLAIWAALPPEQVFLFNKLLTGGFRVGVSGGLVTRALARLAGVEEAELAHRLMGGFEPSAEAFAALLAPTDPDAATPIGRPYPFFLASPLEPERLQSEDPAAWQVEWKWDGIRGQLIRRAGTTFLWSRGEELINGSFPELVALGDTLPDGTVLDGEVIVWRAELERPEPFAALQRRLGRLKPGGPLLREAPAAFLAYDLLEEGGRDRRPEPLRLRLAALEELHQALPAAAHASEAGRLRRSSRLPLPAWEALEPLRQQARAAGAEGLMLKALDSPYLAGRRRGSWWKHKLEPWRLDAVLLYAQAGSGRRANLFTDYTFGLWNAKGELVSFAKAYSGLDDAEITELDRWIRRHTTERFGPARAVQPLLVFELAFEGLQASKRHKSGIAVRFPRIARWRRNKPAAEADTLECALALLQTVDP
jgi:DNA ligase 1